MFIILKIKKYGSSCSLIQTTKSTGDLRQDIFNELNTKTIKQGIKMILEKRLSVLNKTSQKSYLLFNKDKSTKSSIKKCLIKLQNEKINFTLGHIKQIVTQLLYGSNVLNITSKLIKDQLIIQTEMDYYSFYFLTTFVDKYLRANFSEWYTFKNILRKYAFSQLKWLGNLNLGFFTEYPLLRIQYRPILPVRSKKTIKLFIPTYGNLHHIIKKKKLNIKCVPQITEVQLENVIIERYLNRNFIKIKKKDCCYNPADIKFLNTTINLIKVQPIFLDYFIKKQKQNLILEKKKRQRIFDDMPKNGVINKSTLRTLRSKLFNLIPRDTITYEKIIDKFWQGVSKGFYLKFEENIIFILKEEKNIPITLINKLQKLTTSEIRKILIKKKKEENNFEKLISKYNLTVHQKTVLLKLIQHMIISIKFLEMIKLHISINAIHNMDSVLLLLLRLKCDFLPIHDAFGIWQTEDIKKYYIAVIFKLYNKIKLEDIFFNNQFLKEHNIPIEKFYDKKTLLKIQINWKTGRTFHWRIKWKRIFRLKLFIYKI